MRTHEAKLKAMASELRQHRAAHLGKKARGKEAEEQRQKEAYLEFEVSLPARATLWLLAPPVGPLCPHTEAQTSDSWHGL